MLQQSRSSANPGQRNWRSAAIVLLIGWCVVVTIDFGYVMRGAAGLIVNRPEGTEGAVGMPLVGAEVVTTFREMLENAGDAHPWLLILPGETDPFVKTYVRYQLAHIAYPQRVDVATPEEVGPLDDYISIVAPTGFVPSSGWSLVERRDDFMRFERTSS